MNRLTENKVVLVTRRTRLDDLVARFNTVSQAKFCVEHLGADFSEYVREHEQYRASVSATVATLEQIGRLQVLDRSFLRNFIFGNDDTLVVPGQDGLVANTVKYTTTQQVLGVNPDPARWEGVLLPFAVGDLEKILPEVFADRRPIKEVTMAKAELNDGQKLYAVNDLFIGVHSHTSGALYNQRWREERAALVQRSDRIDGSGFDRLVSQPDDRRGEGCERGIRGQVQS